MLQRIQTLYLLLAFVLMAVLLFIPFGSFTMPDGSQYKLNSLGVSVETAADTIVTFSALPAYLLLVTSVLLTLVTIFLYKKRMLQIRFCGLNMVLMLGSVGVMYFFLYQAGKEFSAETHLSIFMFFPIASGILSWLALRAIAKDEALVRSIDRIR